MFKKTGKMVNVSYDEIANIVKKRLNDFDRIEAMTQVTPSDSPYTDPIIYVNEEGKYLQVPEFIQRKVIQEWKGNGSVVRKDDSTETFDKETGADTGSQYSYTYTMYFVIIVLVFIILVSSFTPYQ